MSKKISLALVDDHQIVIDGLLSLLDDSPEFEIAFSSTQPQEVLALLENAKVDVLITDVMMPGLPGNKLAKEVRTTFPQIKILALSMNSDSSIIDEMINDADIAGYVLKNIDKNELQHAIKKIAGGGIYFSEEVLSEMMKSQVRKKENEDAHLTNREKQIIRLIEKEYSNKKIAAELFLSERTVETHRKNIFRKTKTNSLIGLIKYAYEQKLI